MIRTLASGDIRSLDGTTGATFPFWSPDGRWLAFFADGKLKKTQSEGGPVQIVADAHAGRSGSWSREDIILFAPDIEGPLLKVPEGGGTPEPAMQPPGEQSSHRNPHFLDDGIHFLYIDRAYGAAPPTGCDILPRTQTGRSILPYLSLRARTPSGERLAGDRSPRPDVQPRPPHR